MFQNDPLLWSYGGKEREQALLQEAEEYRRAKQVEGNHPVASGQAKRLAMALGAAAVIVLWIAWVVVAG